MISVIIVTHNSQAVLGQCLRCMEGQTVKPDSIILVDSGSVDRQYLQDICLATDMETTLLLEENRGFASANNVGYKHVDPASDFVVFLNPDAFLVSDSLEKAINSLTGDPGVGCVGGRLLGYDCANQKFTGVLDSTGVFRKWYGRWYDRGQGVPDSEKYSKPEDLPAACGAFLFCRKKMLDQVALAEGIIFDPDFFLYKEDIELCLRIRKASWRILYQPDLLLYHCRGWGSRQQISHELRLTAAESELLLYRKHPSFYMLWAVAKYILVRWLHI